MRTLKLAVGIYLLVFVLKIVVYFFTGVMALLAEALHTLSDIFISGFLLVATIWSRKEADEVYMFGHGRAQNVAALVAATLLSLSQATNSTRKPSRSSLWLRKHLIRTFSLRSR